MAIFKIWQKRKEKKKESEAPFLSLWSAVVTISGEFLEKIIIFFLVNSFFFKERDFMIRIFIFQNFRPLNAVSPKLIN